MILMKQRFELKKKLEEAGLTPREKNYIEGVLRDKSLENRHLHHGVKEERK